MKKPYRTIKVEHVKETHRFVNLNEVNLLGRMPLTRK